MNYWDSCAIIPLCFEGDAFTECARDMAIKDSHIVTWWGTPVECCSTFARLRRSDVVSPEEEHECRKRLNLLVECWSEVEPSEKLRQIARQLPLRQDIRAADALQLAAAITWANGDVDGAGFISFDNKLRIAAQSEGFNLIPSQQDYEKMRAK